MTDAPEDFCAATKLLLARMKSNPDEFVPPSESRWTAIIDCYMDTLPDQDRNAIDKGISAILIDEFHKEVMKELVDGEHLKRVEEQKRFRYVTSPAYTGIAGSAINAANAANAVQHGLSPYQSAYQDQLSQIQQTQLQAAVQMFKNDTDKHRFMESVKRIFGK